jgi:hypothetical protein
VKIVSFTGWDFTVETTNAQTITGISTPPIIMAIPIDWDMPEIRAPFYSLRTLMLME